MKKGDKVRIVKECNSVDSETGAIIWLSSGDTGEIIKTQGKYIFIHLHSPMFPSSVVNALRVEKTYLKVIS